MDQASLLLPPILPSMPCGIASAWLHLYLTNTNPRCRCHSTFALPRLAVRRCGCTADCRQLGRCVSGADELEQAMALSVGQSGQFRPHKPASAPCWICNWPTVSNKADTEGRCRHCSVSQTPMALPWGVPAQQGQQLYGQQPYAQQPVYQPWQGQAEVSPCLDHTQLLLLVLAHLLLV